MKKFTLFFTFCFVFTLLSVAQNNIVKSLERNVPGQGKVNIHQDARIDALIGTEYTPTTTDEKKDIKAAGYRIQVYAGNNTRQVISQIFQYILFSILPVGCAAWVTFVAWRKLMQ